MLRAASSIASRAAVIGVPNGGDGFRRAILAALGSSACGGGGGSGSEPSLSVVFGASAAQDPRFYSTTRPSLSVSGGGGGDKDDDDEIDDEEALRRQDPNIIHMINSDISQEEAHALFREELAKLEAEEEAKKFKDWKPGERKKPLQISYRLEDFEDEILGVKKWTLRDKRCGALAIKLGMMPLWDEWGERHPCTVLYVDSNVVLQCKTAAAHGYDAVQIGAGERKRKNVSRALLGIYEHLGVGHDAPPYVVREFRITTNHDASLPPGTRIHARHFVPGQNVDVSGTSKGKGFQGAMKRWGFSGMPASHGTSRSHRALGSTGQCQDPGRVFKGKKMAGRMGNDRVTVQNLRIVKIDRGRDLIYVKGAVPGQNGNFVEIRDAVKKPLFGTAFVEGGVECKFPPLPTFEYEEGVDGCGEAGHEIMMPLTQRDPLVADEDAA